mmetsp:Transcript_8890/g.29242  ORF Transcript_8890/g.29242 Transcript_8890/m.29242 type:complete len:322 (+) Transcript_8890:1053-2018(+)
MALVGVVVHLGRFVGDGDARLRHAGAVRDAEIVSRPDSLRRDGFELPFFANVVVPERPRREKALADSPHVRDRHAPGLVVRPRLFILLRLLFERLQALEQDLSHALHHLCRPLVPAENEAEKGAVVHAHEPRARRSGAQSGGDLHAPVWVRLLQVAEEEGALPDKVARPLRVDQDVPAVELDRAIEDEPDGVVLLPFVDDGRRCGHVHRLAQEGKNFALFVRELVHRLFAVEASARAPTSTADAQRVLSRGRHRLERSRLAHVLERRSLRRRTHAERGVRPRRQDPEIAHNLPKLLKVDAHSPGGSVSSTTRVHDGPQELR